MYSEKLLGINTTGDPAFSMFNLSLKEDWANSRKFCHRLSDDEDEEQSHLDAIQVVNQVCILRANISTYVSFKGGTNQIGYFDVNSMHP